MSKLHYKGCVAENQLRVFDVEKKAFVATCNGYKDGTIHFLDFFTQKVLFEKEFSDFVIPSFLTDNGNGELLYIYTDSVQFYFATLNPITQEEQFFQPKDAIRIRYLHPIYEKKGEFTFGYTSQNPDGNLCRLGILSFNKPEPHFAKD